MQKLVDLWFVEENGAPRASAARPGRNGEISDRAHRPHADGCNGNDDLGKAGLGDFSRIVKTVQHAINIVDRDLHLKSGCQVLTRRQKGHMTHRVCCISIPSIPLVGENTIA
jgi:hypothetical protein